MSTLSVSTIQSSNSTSDLTIRASNTSGSQIVLFANGAINLQTMATVNTGAVVATNANFTNATITTGNVVTLSSNSASIANATITTGNVVTLSSNSASIANATITTLRIANGNPGTAGQLLQSNGTAVVWGSAGGAASFNTNISDQIGFAVTTSLSPAFTAPATANRRYVVHSIHVTNISSNLNDIYVELEGTLYANTTIAGNIPVPTGVSFELLDRPKVLYPNDLIKMRTTANSAMHALIVYETSTDTNLFGRGYHVGTGNITFDMFTASGNSVIESLQLTNFSNTLSRDVVVQTVWVNASNVIQGYFTFGTVVPNKSVIEVLDAPKVLPSGHKIQVQATETDHLDVIVSGKLI